MCFTRRRYWYCGFAMSMRVSHRGFSVENMETLYKCAGLFDCLRPMCDSFSKGICVDAVIKGDWYRLKCMLQIQVHNRFVFLPFPVQSKHSVRPQIKPRVTFSIK